MIENRSNEGKGARPRTFRHSSRYVQRWYPRCKGLQHSDDLLLVAPAPIV